MLEDYISDESKQVVSNAYLKLYNTMGAFETIHSLNRFNKLYDYRHNNSFKTISDLNLFGIRKAKVFERYVDMVIYKRNPFNTTGYEVN